MSVPLLRQRNRMQRLCILQISRWITLITKIPICYEGLTSYSKTHPAYTLVDPGASHCYIDSTYSNQLGLPLRHAGRMTVTTAGTKHPPSDRYQMWPSARIRGITGNYADITGWFTIFVLNGAYHLIVGKNWQSKTQHLVDSNNTLYLLGVYWTILKDGRPAF